MVSADQSKVKMEFIVGGSLISSVHFLYLYYYRFLSIVQQIKSPLLKAESKRFFNLQLVKYFLFLLLIYISRGVVFPISARHIISSTVSMKVLAEPAGSN